MADSVAGRRRVAPRLRHLRYRDLHDQGPPRAAVLTLTNRRTAGASPAAALVAGVGLGTAVRSVGFRAPLLASRPRGTHETSFAVCSRLLAGPRGAGRQRRQGSWTGRVHAGVSEHRLDVAID